MTRYYILFLLGGMNYTGRGGTVNIGAQIKNLRKMAGLSQAELALGICSQAQLSKIENKREVPSAEILYKLSRRLGVDMNYFFEISETPRLDYVIQFKELVSKLKRERNYEELLEVIQYEKNNPLFNSKENQQFLLWHEAICKHYLHNKSKEAIKLLVKALNFTHLEKQTYYTENEIEILNSISIIQKDLKLYKESEYNFKQCLEALKYTPKINNKLIKIRVLYGLSKLLTDLERFCESIEYCNEGIKICKQLETMYLFGEITYQLGENYAKLGDVIKANNAFEKSIQIFTLQDNDKFIRLVKKLREELLL